MPSSGPVPVTFIVFATVGFMVSNMTSVPPSTRPTTMAAFAEAAKPSVVPATRASLSDFMRVS